MIKKPRRKKQKRQLLQGMIAAGMKLPTMIPAVVGSVAVRWFEGPFPAVQARELERQGKIQIRGYSPSGLDAWVGGNDPVVVIDFQGMVDYVKTVARK